MMKKYFLLFILITILVCCKEMNNENKVSTKPEMEVIADTIIYDVLLKNPDPTDEWTQYRLQSFKLDQLVDYVFDGVYSGQLKPIDFFSEQDLNIKDIKLLEKEEEFSRDKIARAQFEEIWYYNKKKHIMQKHVHSIMLAYEVYNREGKIKGYKPAFKVYLNH